MGFDPLSAEERAAELARARPRSLPIAPRAGAALRRLPLADDARPSAHGSLFVARPKASIQTKSVASVTRELPPSC